MEEPHNDEPSGSENSGSNDQDWAEATPVTISLERVYAHTAYIADSYIHPVQTMLDFGSYSGEDGISLKDVAHILAGPLLAFSSGLEKSPNEDHRKLAKKAKYLFFKLAEVEASRRHPVAPFMVHIESVEYALSGAALNLVDIEDEISDTAIPILVYPAFAVASSLCEFDKVLEKAQKNESDHSFKAEEITENCFSILVLDYTGGKYSSTYEQACKEWRLCLQPIPPATRWGLHCHGSCEGQTVKFTDYDSPRYGNAMQLMFQGIEDKNVPLAMRIEAAEFAEQHSPENSWYEKRANDLLQSLRA